MDSAEQRGRLARVGLLHGWVGRASKGWCAENEVSLGCSERATMHPAHRPSGAPLRRVEARLCALGEQHWMDAIESGLRRITNRFGQRNVYLGDSRRDGLHRGYPRGG